jgi:RimJ/RimL family protein N-acetyltransferase
LVDPIRHRYRIALPARESRLPPDLPFVLRHPKLEDRDALAELMLDAYRDTIDYEGEGIDEATDEVDGYLANEPMLDNSWVVEDRHTLLAAILIASFEDGPLVSYVMTRASAKGNGLATVLLEMSLRDLHDQGWSSVDAFITAGNTPSERLFARPGARLIG